MTNPHPAISKRRAAGQPHGRLATWASVLALSSLLCGCDDSSSTSRITAENYALIKEGMTLPEVEAILGPGVETRAASGVNLPTIQIGDTKIGGMATAKMIDWRGPGASSITVTFFNERVAQKSASGL